jgi:putative transposase
MRDAEEKAQKLNSESQATTPVFRPFDPQGPVRVYLSNLPHWRQAGATYFVTFRQDDSIPAKVLAEWLDIRKRWYRAHQLDATAKDCNPERFAQAYARIPAPVRRAFEKEQSRMLHEELDRCHGSCVLKHRDARAEVVKSLGFFHGQRLWLGDSVVMPNHVHPIVIPFDGWELEDLLGSIKKWTSHVIAKRLKAGSPDGQLPGLKHNKQRFWQYESYDRVIRDVEELAVFRRYIARNAEAAQLREGEFDYLPVSWLDDFAPRPAFS